MFFYFSDFYVIFWILFFFFDLLFFRTRYYYEILLIHFLRLIFLFSLTARGTGGCESIPSSCHSVSSTNSAHSWKFISRCCSQKRTNSRCTQTGCQWWWTAKSNTRFTGKRTTFFPRFFLLFLSPFIHVEKIYYLFSQLRGVESNIFFFMNIQVRWGWVGYICFDVLQWWKFGYINVVFWFLFSAESKHQINFQTVRLQWFFFFASIMNDLIMACWICKYGNEWKFRLLSNCKLHRFLSVESSIMI